MIEEKILKSLSGGDILFIVPPFSILEGCSLGLHNLQQIAKNEGLKAEVFYANMLLASKIGIENYKKIYDAPLYWMVQERLFARCAHGLPPLGIMPEKCNDEIYSIHGNGEDNKDYVKFFYDVENFNTEHYSGLESICYNFIEEISQVINKLSYKIIGCTNIISHTNSCISILNSVKKLNNEVITLIGGANCNGEMAKGIASLTNSINYIFTGSSENTFKKFLTDYKQERLPQNQIIEGKKNVDLNQLKLPDYNEFITQAKVFLGFEPQDIEILYETSRGCEWAKSGKCHFCGIEEFTPQRKDVEKVINDLNYLNENYPGKRIYCTDDMMPTMYRKKLVPLLKEKNLLSLAYMVRLPFTLQNLIDLKKAKIDRILPGIESLSTENHKLINKGIKSKDCINFLRLGHSVDIRIYWFIIWGIPGDKAEAYKEMLELFPLIRHLQAPDGFVHLKLYRFSNFFDNHKTFNIRNLRPMHVYNMVYPESADIQKAAFYMAGDYECEAHQNMDIINKMYDEIKIWTESWKKSYLHLIKSPISNNDFIIMDKRGIDVNEKSYVIDFKKVKDIMVCKPYNVESASENIEWALQNKLGIIRDNYYVPLVTAPSELLLKIEDSVVQKTR